MEEHHFDEELDKHMMQTISDIKYNKRPKYVAVGKIFSKSFIFSFNLSTNHPFVMGSGIIINSYILCAVRMKVTASSALDG